MNQFSVESLKQAATLLEDAALSADRLYWILAEGKCDCRPKAKYGWRDGAMALIFDESPSPLNPSCPYASLSLPTEAQRLIDKFREVSGEAIESDLVRVATAGPPVWRTSWMTALEWLDAFFVRLEKWKAGHDQNVSAWLTAKASGDPEQAANLETFIGAAMPGFGPLRREVLDGLRGETAATIRWMMDRAPAAKENGSTSSSPVGPLTTAEWASLFETTDRTLRGWIEAGSLVKCPQSSRGRIFFDSSSEKMTPEVVKAADEIGSKRKSNRK